MISDVLSSDEVVTLSLPPEKSPEAHKLCVCVTKTNDTDGQVDRLRQNFPLTFMPCFVQQLAQTTLGR